ncbi:MAG: DNA repair protein, partial [Rickettsiales bacterium]|nr:DNA repair protein [Rickettsiales bacterium]
MTSENTLGTSKTVLESIYEWSLNKPLWQRDALRRIVQFSAVSDDGMNELLLLLKAGKLDGKNELDNAIPLQLEHIPSRTASAEGVWLENICDVKGVNNLAVNQTLSFASKGITVIYGDNGAGKSGYTRILKSACRARHRSEILSNIYATEPQEPPTALIQYGKGTESGEIVQWENSDKPDPTLSAVSVFDRECASVHLKKKNKVAYRPYGLDIPDILADVCKQLEKKLGEELKGLQQKKNDLFLNPPWQPNTEVGQTLSKLSGNTEVSALEKLSKLTSEEKERLTQLNETLSKDIKKAAIEQNNKANNVKSLQEYINTLCNQFSDQNVEAIINLKSSASSSREAANLAAQSAFSGDLLPEVGGDVWKKLWEAA